MRDGQWKLIDHFEDDQYELFDLENHVSETRELAQAQPQVLDRLREALRQWLTEFDALMPRPNANWQPDPLGKLLIPQGYDSGSLFGQLPSGSSSSRVSNLFAAFILPIIRREY